MVEVDLTDLEVISRWSLALRAGTADIGEVIQVLQADLEWLESIPQPGAVRGYRGGSELAQPRQPPTTPELGPPPQASPVRSGSRPAPAPAAAGSDSEPLSPPRRGARRSTPGDPGPAPRRQLAAAPPPPPPTPPTPPASQPGRSRQAATATTTGAGQAPARTVRNPR